MAAERTTDAEVLSGALLERRITLRAATVITATVVGLTFMFGFGHDWTLALRLVVPPWVAPLVAPICLSWACCWALGTLPRRGRSLASSGRHVGSWSSPA